LRQDILDALTALAYLVIPTGIVALALYTLGRSLGWSKGRRRGLVVAGGGLTLMVLATVAVLVIRAYITYPFLD
jgi:hypothetical protein